MYLVNAFSLNMLPQDKEHKITTRPLGREEAREICGWDEPVCAIGHEDLWNMVKEDLYLAPDKENQGRITITLAHLNEVLVAQYRGPRLPEGATSLPAGAKIEYMLVKVLNRRVMDEQKDEQVARLQRLLKEAKDGKEGQFVCPKEALDVPYECGGFPGTVLDMVEQLKTEHAAEVRRQHTRLGGDVHHHAPMPGSGCATPDDIAPGWRD